MNAKTTLSGHVNHNKTLVQESAGSAGVRVKTQVRGGRLAANHNETLVQESAGSAGVRVKTRVRGGRLASNHNETLVRDRA